VLLFRYVSVAVFIVAVFMIVYSAYNSKQKNRFCIFHFIFMGVKPFDSAALGRLIERVVDSGFGYKKPETSFYNKSINGGTIFPKSSNIFKGKTVPRFLIISKKNDVSNLKKQNQTSSNLFSNQNQTLQIFFPTKIKL